jgi:hypothetical protein
MEDQTLTRNITECAFRVFNQFGFDFLESVYEKFMLLEPQKP